MATVRFTRHLRRFFPNLAECEVDASTVAEVLLLIDERFPGLRHYVVDDAGRLRQHVNVFVDGELVADRVTLSDAVEDQTEVYIMQALSGG